MAPSVSVLSVFNSGTKRRRIANIADLEKMESLSRATFLDVIAGKKEVSESDRLPLLSFVAAACREEEQEEERYVHSKGSGKR